MKSNHKVAIALVAGTVIGAAAIQGLHAQSTPKAYVVTEIEVMDQGVKAKCISSEGGRGN